MENFVTKFKGSSKDEHSSIKTSSNPDKDNEESIFSEVSHESEDKDPGNEDSSQPKAGESPHGIKQVSFPEEKVQFVEDRMENQRLTTPESAAPFDTITPSPLFISSSGPV